MASLNPDTGSTYTQQELAEKIGATKNTVSEIERGREPSLSVLAGIAQELSVSIAELLGEQQNATPRTESNATSRSEAQDAKVDPVRELVIRGQAEQAAWVLEFAAKLLEAGAKHLRLATREMADQTVMEAATQDLMASVRATSRPRKEPAPPKAAQQSRNTKTSRR